MSAVGDLALVENGNGSIGPQSLVREAGYTGIWTASGLSVNGPELPYPELFPSAVFA
jgi:hypothetical protein